MSSQLRRSPRLAAKAPAPESVTTLETILFNLAHPLFQQLQGTRDVNDRAYIIHDIMTLMRMSRNLLIRSPKFRMTLSTAINKLWAEMESHTDVDPVLKSKCDTCFTALEGMMYEIRYDSHYIE